jgi:AcrR family transcriptional regulator
MQEKIERLSNDARSARTRAALIAAGRSLFVARGFAATATPEIVERAGLTRGALYHHFADKRALLAAVVEAENAALVEAIAAAPAAGEGALAALRGGAAAYLAAMCAPGRAALLLREAPAALGPEAARDSDARHARASLRDGLAAAMRAGEIRALPLEALTDALAGAFDGAAAAMLEGRPEAEAATAVLALIDGLAGGPGAGLSSPGAPTSRAAARPEPPLRSAPAPRPAAPRR